MAIGFQSNSCRWVKMFGRFLGICIWSQNVAVWTKEIATRKCGVFACFRVCVRGPMASVGTPRSSSGTLLGLGRRTGRRCHLGTFNGLCLSDESWPLEKHGRAFFGSVNYFRMLQTGHRRYVQGTFRGLYLPQNLPSWFAVQWPPWEHPGPPMGPPLDLGHRAAKEGPVGNA